MKKQLKVSYLLALLISISLLTGAQTEKGNYLIGASSSLDFSSLSMKWKTDYNSGDDGKINSLEFTPAVGYFLANNFAVGAGIGLSRTVEKEDNDKYINSVFSILPFARYYFGKKNVKPYLHGAVGPGWGKNKNDRSFESTIEIDSDLFLYELGGGIAFFLNEKVSLDIGFGYVSARSKWEDLSKMDRENTADGIATSIGVAVYL